MIEWDVVEAIWDENYRELKKYFIKNGDSNIDIRLSGLGVWTDRQRVRFRKGDLSEDQIKKLKKINFIFNPQDQAWEKNFKELENLIINKEDMPSRDTPLGKWVKAKK